MKIEILGAESLGARSLCCLIELKERKIIIDPGVALDDGRFNLLPHPFQIGIANEIRKKIIEDLRGATDIVITHFHGDHTPLPNPDLYQIGITQVLESFSKARLWIKGPEGLVPFRRNLRETLSSALFRKFPIVEGQTESPFSFSLPVFHGERGSKLGKVMMVRIEEGNEVFVFASDIQLLDEEAVDQILNWSPTIILVSGPPLYLPLTQNQRKLARFNAWRLAQKVKILILEHHLLRSEEGIEWLRELRKTTKNKVCSAAEFMEREPIFLEAWRRKLYRALPVPENWHRDYEQGRANFNDYLIKGREFLKRGVL